MQKQLIETLKNLTESRESEIVVLKNEIRDLKAEVQNRNLPMVAQMDIDKLREEIMLLTYQKAELELSIRKSWYFVAHGTWTTQ